MNIKWSDVCRLCLAKDNLVWIFDKRFENSENMKDVIYITTGVEITIKDVASQKVCKKCCEFTIKMFEFRRTSVTNDRFLREQDKPSITDICKIKLEAGVKKNTGTILDSNNFEKHIQEPLEPKAFCPHPTVQDLYTRYPKLKLPTICLKSDIDPYVSLQMDHVEKYFKVRNLDFIKYTKLALRPQTVAKKKTTRVPPNVSTSDGNKMTQVIFNEALSSLRVPPIKINQGDSEYHETTTKNSADKDANKVSDSTKDYKKRKYSEVDLTPKDQNFKKLSTVETLTVVPKVNVLSSTTLYMCDICNAVQSTAKYLRKHRNKHLRCQFCKKKCETLDNKQHHIRNTCLVKKCLNSSPDVELTKVECDTSIRRKYPNAFTEFPQLKNIGSDIKIASTSNSLASRDIDSMQSNITDYPTVIEILSDDEETIPASNIIDNVNLQNIANASNGKQKSTSSDSSVPVVVEKLHSTISVVKPDIRIKGDNYSILQRMDTKLPDTKIIKELLGNKPLRFTMGKNIQTNLPNNNLISINSNDTAIELKSLKQHLYVYKIPVEVRLGSLGASYDYHSKRKQPRGLSLWNDLSAIDVKANLNVKKTVIPTINRTVNQSISETSSMSASSVSVQLASSVSVQPASSILVQPVSSLSNNKRPASTSTVYSQAQVNLNNKQNCTAGTATYNLGIYNPIRQSNLVPSNNLSSASICLNNSNVNSVQNAFTSVPPYSTTSAYTATVYSTTTTPPVYSSQRYNVQTSFVPNSSFYLTNATNRAMNTYSNQPNPTSVSCNDPKQNALIQCNTGPVVATTVSRQVVNTNNIQHNYNANANFVNTKNNVQHNYNAKSSHDSTASYSKQTQGSQKLGHISKNVTNSTASSPTIINLNPMLNSFLSTASTTAASVLVNSVPASTLANTATSSNDNIRTGVIRVKSVWELK